MDGSSEGLDVVVVLTEREVLTGTYSLACNEVRIHTLPTTRKCTAMEDDFESVVVGISHNFFVELHGLLLIRADEVNLQTLHTSFLQPSHLLVTLNHQMEFATRSLRSIIPITVGIVPKIHTNIF